jgi:peptidoglycan/xylan/chitin deacetylase (PgdA/CDA1 family)
MAGDVLVLCYHAVSDDWPSQYSVTPADLERQVAGLLRHGYRAATFHQAVAAPPAPRTLAVTFDDALSSVFERALPVLSGLGVPATVFPCTDAVGSGLPVPFAPPGWQNGDHDHDLRPMSWDELGQAAEVGWEIGSHTRSHPWLTALDADELADELESSKAECEARLPGACRSLAYPFGDTDARVVEAARAAGYQAAGGVLWGTEPFGPLHWPRIVVLRRDGGRRFGLKVARPLRGLRASATWRWIERLRSSQSRSQAAEAVR